jgi:HK97 family phage major capsid protein
MDMPLEIREEPSNPPTDDPIALATRSVEEMRTASEQFRANAEQQLRAANDRIAALETRLSRPAVVTGARAGEGEALQRRAFDGFVRRGDGAQFNQWMELEPRTAGPLTSSTSDGPDAGFLIPPPEFIQEIDRNLVLFSPMRSIARVANMSSGQIILPKRTGNLSASWEGETTAEPQTNPVYGSQTITAYELKCYADVSNKLLDDATFDVGADLAFDFGQDFGRAEGAAFVVGAGSGSNQPLGLTAATITTTTVAATTGPTADEIIAFFYSLPSPYAQNATWIMNRATIGYLRGLKTTIGSYLWPGLAEGLTNGNPNLLLGRPVVEFPDMPDLGAGNIAIAFGDFRSGFRIFDRISLRLLRDPYSQATNSNVRFHARRRVAGEVTKAEALRLMKCAAS